MWRTPRRKQLRRRGRDRRVGVTGSATHRSTVRASKVMTLPSSVASTAPPTLTAHNVATAMANHKRLARPASGRGDTIRALGQEERAHLFPLQRHGYPCCRTRATRATRQSLVTFERNRYSVPTRYEGQRLLLRAFPWEIEITDGQTVVARHPRLYGRDGEQLDPLHYLALLEHKAGAFDLARPIQQWATQWPPIYRTYLAALQLARPQEARREFVRILQLHARYTPAVLPAALERAYGLCCWSADGVAQLVYQELDAPPPATLVDLEALPTLTHLAQLQIPLPDPHCFDRLFAYESPMAAAAATPADENSPGGYFPIRRSVHDRDTHAQSRSDSPDAALRGAPAPPAPARRAGPLPQGGPGRHPAQPLL